MSEPFWRRPVYALCCCVAIVLIATGIRQSFGLFVKPITIEMGWGFGVFSSAVAIQNLMIGLGAPNRSVKRFMSTPSRRPPGRV